MQNARQLFPMMWIPALVLLCLCGCASAGYNKGNAAARSLQTAAASIESESQDLNTAVQQLNELVNNPATDLRQQFKLYDKALDRLYGSIEQSERAVQRSQRKSDAYFHVWDKQLGAMNYEMLRTRGENRKTAVSNQLETISQRYRESREVVLPLLAYLEDIRKALGADLTIGGLESVKDAVANAAAGVEKVQAALAQSVNDFTTSSGQLSSEYIRNPEVQQTTQQTPMTSSETANH